LLAIFGSLLPWFAFGFGELSISSALASILNATTPLWTAVFAFWVTPAERPSPLNYLGVAIGFLGVGVLIAPDLIGQPLRATTVGTLAIAGAAASYAVAALIQRRRLRGVSPLQVGFWQLALAAPLALAASLPTIGATRLTMPSIAAMLVLGVGGSGIAYLLYYFMMNTLGATRATTVTFLLPVTAVFWGASILNEAITVPILLGMGVILLGVFLTSRQRPRRAAAPAEGRTSNNPPPRPSPARGEGEIHV
jgi:drug/metabolite transporter (DMT)-like permease